MHTNLGKSRDRDGSVSAPQRVWTFNLITPNWPSSGSVVVTPGVFLDPPPPCRSQNQTVSGPGEWSRMLSRGTPFLLRRPGCRGGSVPPEKQEIRGPRSYFMWRLDTPFEQTWETWRDAHRSPGRWPRRSGGRERSGYASWIRSERGRFCWDDTARSRHALEIPAENTLVGK